MYMAISLRFKHDILCPRIIVLIVFLMTCQIQTKTFLGFIYADV